MQCITTEKQSNHISILYRIKERSSKLTGRQSKKKYVHTIESRKEALNSQADRAKENLKLSHGGLSQREASGTNQPMKCIDRSSLSLRTAHCHTIEEETIAINSDWVSNQACRLSHNIYVVTHILIMIDYLFYYLTKAFQRFF